MRISKFASLLTCVTAAIALALLTSSASALREIRISNPGAQRVTGERVSFEDESRFLRTVCLLTLNGTGEERILKAAGNRFGLWTEGRTTGCRAFGFASATVILLVSELGPFFVAYESFLGSLPSILGILTNAPFFSVEIRVSGRTCLYEGEMLTLLTVSASRVEQGSFLPINILFLQAGSTESCPGFAHLRGTIRYERARTVTLV